MLNLSPTLGVPGSPVIGGRHSAIGEKINFMAGITLNHYKHHMCFEVLVLHPFFFPCHVSDLFPFPLFLSLSWGDINILPYNHSTPYLISFLWNTWKRGAPTALLAYISLSHAMGIRNPQGQNLTMAPEKNATPVKATWRVLICLLHLKIIIHILWKYINDRLHSVNVNFPKESQLVTSHKS